MKRRKGFTLIELLVVIAIIALLLAILIPSLQTVKEMAAGSVCLYNQSGLTKAYYIYSQDNDDELVEANQGPNRWVDRPRFSADTSVPDPGGWDAHDTTIGEKENGLMRGTLFPYAESTKLYHCPADKRFRQPLALNVNGPMSTRGGMGAYRSYALPAGANSYANGWDNANGVVISGHTFHAVRKYTDFKSPGTKYIFVEENYTHMGGDATDGPYTAGYNGGVWSFWSGSSYTAWWDPLAPWHNDKTNLGYADGHAEKLVWRDERTIKFAYDRRSVPYDQPGNQDQEYMSRCYPCIR
jgi:prepilin-type N-terminal cleavage/methylation domain-containing protein/prepilin-type processing-associated H-X9-DG protein